MTDERRNADPVSADGPTISSAPVTGGAPALPFPSIEADAYEVGAEIARGGLGRVLRARDRRLDRPVVVKELLHPDAHSTARFEREARLTARLQHPGVVPIYEAGRWQGSGAPFYAMKLVEGRTLEQVARDAGPAERLALVPVVLAVSEAVACAHSQRIIHRDLKPANVLVGPFGETVVVDWGLAKDLADGGASDGPAPAAPRPAAGAGQTIDGAVMGTPGYMSPEQAAGRAVDERTDVYALGAMLYHVLAGRGPFAGETPARVLVRVASGERPAALESVAPGVPPELAAIVAKAMAPDPERRYPTALSLAEDLRRFQTGKLVAAHEYRLGDLARRWVRRHRAAAVAGAAAILLAAAVSAYAWRQVVRARDEARAERDSAEALAGFMLGDLYAKLEPLGRLDVLEGVGGEVRRHYTTVARRHALGWAAERRLARAIYVVGMAQGDKGELPAATATLGQARDALRALSAARAGDQEVEADLVETLEALGKLAVRRGDVDGAVAAYEEALAIVRARDGGAWQEREARLESRLALAYWQRNELDAADAAGRAGYERATRLRAEGDTPARRRAVALAAVALANVRRTRGDRAGAIVVLREARVLLAPLAAADPRNAVLQRELASVHYGLCAAHNDLEDAAAAEACRALHDAVSRLADADPENTQRRREHAIGHAHLMQAASLDARPGEALDSGREALAIYEALVAADPANDEFAENLAAVCLELADELRRAGLLDDARAVLARAAPIVERRATAPDDLFARAMHALFLLARGRLHFARGAPVDARLDAARAAELAGAVVARSPDDGDAVTALVGAQVLLAEVDLATGDLAAAAAAANAARAVAEAWIARGPGDPSRRSHLAAVLTVEGRLAERRGDADAAAAAYREALAVARALGGRSVRGQVKIARAAADLAGVLARRRDTRAEADALAAEALGTLEPLATEGRLDVETAGRLGELRALVTPRR